MIFIFKIKIFLTAYIFVICIYIDAIYILHELQRKIKEKIKFLIFYIYKYGLYREWKTY